MISYMYVCRINFSLFKKKGRNSKILILSNKAKRILCAPYSAIGDDRLLILTVK